jgi:RNA-directed DNA polymerase
MTTPRYAAPACAAGSQEHGDALSPAAWSPSDYAWIVNFNNGNANNNHRNNDACVRAVRSVVPASGECQGNGAQVDLRALYEAWKRARRQKRPSINQLHFDVRWADGLLDLQHQLQAGTWSPRPSTCFIATRPKAREIHAPDFSDRVVHHWLVPQLEALFERGFIHDSYANRVGKGTHAAVERLKQFSRQVHNGQGGGWFLQLDVHNFFNSIHRPTLYAMLKTRLRREHLPLIARRATHALLRRSPIEQGVVYRATADERSQVPPHKRLENAPLGCGIPIGNLSSQFFANVYLDALDQFVKHVLKVPRYLRYVDDFVLVHHDRAQLEAWRIQIAAFLGQQLKLSLKAEQRLQSLTDGIDFLGHVIYPTHTGVRRRVVSHAKDALSAWQRDHVTERGLRATPADLRRAASIWGSYEGHLQHANSWRLRARLHHQFPWLAAATARRRFPVQAEGRTVSIPVTKELHR